ncbi:MAG: OmpH family outer membrane protein [Bacteroidales bacterium]|jgi:outer membrane protein|nr:OmpH family outer membrane protein [Bacteroidales bacterium]
MKKIIIFIFIALNIATYAQKGKFGHVDSNAIFDLMPEKNDSKKTLEEYSRTLEEQMAVLQKEFETKYTEYQSKSTTWSSSIKELKEDDLMTLQQRIQNFQQQAQKDLQEKEASLLEPLYNKIKDAIKTVGEEKALIYVFDVNSLLYFSSESVDVTPDVKTKLGIK